MRSHWLKRLRVLAAFVVLAGLFAAFLDFRELVPAPLAHGLAAIQFVPSMVALITGASFALAGVLVLLMTFLAGRIYCSAVCPLGILQDAIARLSCWISQKRHWLPYDRGYPRLRLTFLGVCVVGILAGWAGLALSFFDPYSIFGRIAHEVFRPVLILANNSLVRIANACGVDWIYWVDPQWAGAGVVVLALLMLALISVLAVSRGRLYCNTVCPVGTLLGWISSHGLFRLGLDKTACRKCGDCLHVCKSQCIDLRSGTVDFSRCVDCFNCIGICKEHAIAFRFAGKKPVSRQPKAPSAPDPQRRKFVTFAALFAGAIGTGMGFENKPPAERLARVISPPGSLNLERFLNRCTACHLCISACPTHVLTPALFEYGLAGLNRPRMDYSRSFCNFECVRCAEVCPDGAITLLALADKKLARIGCAQLDEDKCVVKAKGTDCAACSEHCPTKAVDTIPYGNNLRLPKVNNDLCIGCGACEHACPVKPAKAITVAGLRIHERAEKRVETKAEKPKTSGDFPF